MAMVRRQADSWHREVPGARWFKADLRTHTIDDAPGGRVSLPDAVATPPESPEELAVYARRFLEAAIGNGVQVLGVAPHRPRMADSGELSAAWQIVEEWDSGADAQGVPYREKIFAVFPGFMPSLHDGRGTLRLTFLFDPAIGRDRYLGLHDLIMKGKSPWRGEQPAVTDLGHAEAFEVLRAGQADDQDAGGTAAWDCLTLAPDVFSETGLFGTPAEQFDRDDFDTSSLGGLELPGDLLPTDVFQAKPWVRDFVTRNRLTFFHSSAADAVQDIGARHVWVKMASPTIEALRQAFVASETRVRCGHEIGPDGEIADLDDPPDAARHLRPWLRSVSVAGKASFFGVADDRDAPTAFKFSPDLTCVIGGSMTGKSTLLDGLRVRVGAPLPHDERARSDVTQRAQARLLAGSASVELDCPGRDPTASEHEQWPAVFYTQGELQRLAREPDAVEDVLARLDVSESAAIAERRSRLAELDRELRRAAARLTELEAGVADAEQALARSTHAADELTAFADAGVEEFNRASGAATTWSGYVDAVTAVGGQAAELLDKVEALQMSPAGDDTDAPEVQMQRQWEPVLAAARSLTTALADATGVARAISEDQEQRRNELREQVDRNLAERGFDGSRINALQALNAQAALRDSYQANLDSSRVGFQGLLETFERSLAERRDLVAEQRGAFDRVLDTIGRQFGGRIAARRIDGGMSQNLEQFLVGLGQRGITRWWNDSGNTESPSPDGLLEMLKTDSLESVGMSDAVQETFRAQMTSARRRDLAAVRCPDHYVLEFRPDGDDYRPLDELSGGQRVNLLLSLLLETSDERPLVIDQPEDELDNRFLFETLLPTLGRLKGRRQVILATHNANIVVNGDADQVIQLEASAHRGHVAASGAIEDPTVRDAIVRTVDGGDEAFRLRRIKYGF
jgi:hypothetical protein